MGGHAGITRTFNRLQAIVYWTGMQKEVEEFATSCMTSQGTKYLPKAPFGVYNPYLHLLQSGRTSQWVLSRNYLQIKDILL